MAGKRKRQEDGDATETVLSGQKKAEFSHDLQQNHVQDEDTVENAQSVVTPIKRRRGRPPGSGNKSKALINGIDARSDLVNLPTPRPEGKLLFSTPVKNNQARERLAVPNVDRSAQRKSARTLIEREVADGSTDEEEPEEENILAKKIWEADDGNSDDQQDEVEDDLQVDSATPATPSKRKRGRRKRSPTPPRNLPPHEQYFWQNRPGKIKTSNNSLSSLSLLTHEQYHNQISAYRDPHASSYAFLHSLHSRSFPQWRFEFSQSFSICLYGYGSKRKLVSAFCNYLHSLTPSDPPKIFVVNGYTLTLTLRHLLNTFATVVFDCTTATIPVKLGTQPREILNNLLAHLVTHPPASPYHIFINSLDAPPLRRAPSPSIIAQLAASPHIHLLATCDTPNFPLLWDTNLLDKYNFLFHDTTTFEPYAPIEIPSVIDDVNELLGRSGRTVKGKEGVGFVLRSLPENARSLYRVLIGELLGAMDEEGEVGAGEAGVEYRVLYQKVVEDFICSNEMGFRQLLKEFYDHQMVTSRRDGGGAEMLSVPFRREEMEAILEDLME